MKTLLLSLLLLPALCAEDFTVSLNEEQVYGLGHILVLENQAAEDAHNLVQSEAKERHEAEQAEKPAAERVAFTAAPFVPLTPAQALQRWVAKHLVQAANRRDAKVAEETVDEIVKLPFASRRAVIDALSPTVNAEIGKHGRPNPTP